MTSEENNQNPIEKMFNEMNKSYNEYKKNHPDFAKVVEQDSEGKTDKKFEEQFKDNEKEYHITTLTGPQAQSIMDILKRGPAFTFKDKSMPGVSVLEVYSNLDPNKTEYWE